MNEFLMLFTEKNKCKVGAEIKEKHSSMARQSFYLSLQRRFLIKRD